MEIKKEYKEIWKYKIKLKEKDNISYTHGITKQKIINNCLEVIYLCRNYYFNINRKRIKTNIIRFINKLSKTNYINNKIRRITIKYNNKITYKARSYNNANIELNIEIN